MQLPVPDTLRTGWWERCTIAARSTALSIGPSGRGARSRRARAVGAPLQAGRQMMLMEPIDTM
jgi:hypothetical protein